MLPDSDVNSSTIQLHEKSGLHMGLPIQYACNFLIIFMNARLTQPYCLCKAIILNYLEYKLTYHFRQVDLCSSMSHSSNGAGLKIVAPYLWILSGFSVAVTQFAFYCNAFSLLPQRQQQLGTGRKLVSVLKSK